MSLTDCRVALEAYCKGRETLDPIEEWKDDFQPPGHISFDIVSGTLGILWKHSAKFFVLGSISRGIPRREWNISLDHLNAYHFTSHPQANVLAIIERRELM